jgi:hypothetical protein
MDCGNPSDLILDEILEKLSSTSTDLKNKLEVYRDNQIFYWFCSLLVEKPIYILFFSRSISYFENQENTFIA